MPKWIKLLYIAVLKYNAPVETLRAFRRTGEWSLLPMTGMHQGNIQMFIDLMQLPEWSYDHDKFEQALSRKRIDHLHEWLETDKYRY